MTTAEREERIRAIRDILSPIMPHGIGEVLAIGQAQQDGTYDQMIERNYEHFRGLLMCALMVYKAEPETNHA